MIRSHLGPHPSRFPTPLAALRAHWPLYLYEGAELGAFMLSACLFTVLLANIPGVPGRALMGLAMGATAIAIIKSPWGKASGAHFNPAITLTFYRLGKIGPWDATFYVIGQFVGSVAGVGLSKLLLGPRLSAVHYAVTVPGVGGVPGAFAAETFMAALLMATVLVTSRRPARSPWTTWLVGLLICLYIVVFAPVSGFSINPARTVGSAVFAHLYTALWVYFTAPPLGMFAAAELFAHTPQSSLYFTHRHLTHPLHGVAAGFTPRLPTRHEPGL